MIVLVVVFVSARHLSAYRSVEMNDVHDPSFDIHVSSRIESNISNSADWQLHKRSRAILATLLFTVHVAVTYASCKFRI
jgi:hypothetical protein